MKIPYKKSRNYFDLLIAIIWGIIYFASYSKPKTNILDYTPLICFVGFLLYFFIDKKVYYLTLKNGILKTGKIIVKKINLAEIKKITKSKEDYILETDKTTLKINIKLIDKESLTDLNTIFNKLNLST